MEVESSNAWLAWKQLPEQKKTELLELYGWVMECESPLELRHADSGSFACGFGARLVLEGLMREAN